MFFLTMGEVKENTQFNPIMNLRPVVKPLVMTLYIQYVLWPHVDLTAVEITPRCLALSCELVHF